MYPMHAPPCTVTLSKMHYEPDQSVVTNSIADLVKDIMKNENDFSVE